MSVFEMDRVDRLGVPRRGGKKMQRVMSSKLVQVTQASWTNHRPVFLGKIGHPRSVVQVVQVVQGFLGLNHKNN
jgi:hypothetical protein